MIHVEELCRMRSNIVTHYHAISCQCKSIFYILVTYIDTSLPTRTPSSQSFVVSSRDVSRRALQVPSLMASCAGRHHRHGIQMEVSNVMGVYMGVPQNGWFIKSIIQWKMDGTWVNMDDLGYPPFKIVLGNLHVPSWNKWGKTTEKKKIMLFTMTRRYDELVLDRGLQTYSVSYDSTRDTLRKIKCGDGKSPIATFVSRLPFGDTTIYHS